MSDLDFEVDVRSREDGDYDVVVRSFGGNPTARMKGPFAPDDLPKRMMALENALLRSAQPRRQAVTDIEQPVRQFGQDLFDALIAGEIHASFYGTLDRAAGLGQPMRIKLKFDSPALSALPWEFLIDRAGKDYLGLSARTPIVRSITSDEPSPPLTVKSPLRMLAMVASPTDKDLPMLDVGREKSRVDEATAKLQADGLLELHWTTTGTYRELQDELQRSDWHIFHFAGHGGFNRARDTGFLVFVNETTGGRDDVSATELALILFQREKGRPAETLDELVPGVLAELPLDPHTGKPFRYRIAVEKEIPDISPGQGVIVYDADGLYLRLGVPRLR